MRRIQAMSLVSILLAAGFLLGADTPANQGPAAEKLAAAFAADCAAKAQEAEKAQTITVSGKDGWLLLAGELRHVGVGKFWGEQAVKVSKAAKPEQADPMPAILDFQEQLSKMGIELIFMPVPPKAFIYPEMLSDVVNVEPGKGPPRLDVQHQAFYKALREKGVNVLDLTEPFLAARFDKEGALYCKQDSHWSGRGCVLAAKLIAAQLKDKAWLKDVPRQTLADVWKPVTISGDLWRALGKADAPRETIPLRFVGKPPQNNPQPLESNPSSPVVLMGDSHCLVFNSGDDMHAVGAGLPDQLAAELGFPVDLVASKGSGETTARINLARAGLSNKAYWAGKKVVIWCVSARVFTESAGWRKVPLTKQ